MGTLKIIVRNDALSFIEKTIEWYLREMPRQNIIVSCLIPNIVLFIVLPEQIFL